MARRPRKPAWARSFQRSIGALTRATLRAGKRAVLKAGADTARAATQAAAKKAMRTALKPRASPAAAAPADWIAGRVLGPAGARRYRLYQPPGASRSARLPLLVMLHGCGQDAASFAHSTRLHRLAAREGFCVLYPEQDRLANAQGCWNWFETRSGRAYTEAATIVAAIDQVCTLHAADASRVAVAGFSAGAGMAALLALRYAGRFKAVAMHSGVAPGAAHSSATAMSAMHGRRHPAPLSAAEGAALPPLLVIQGSADYVVKPSNGQDAAALWANAMGAAARPPRIVQRGHRHAMTVTDFKHGARTLISLCEVSGLTHAWSGGAAGQPYSDAHGPDASRMIWAFALKQFRALQSAAKQ
jgi:poly(hydroxyalkanoate) depolymerase family esterase